MPNARPGTISFVCEWLKNHSVRDIKSVLDIGCGFGKWGFLARLYIQAWNHDITKKDYRTWKERLRVDAIEIFADYLTDLQYLIYNSIYVGDARVLIKSVDHYDLIIMGDVLEHVSFEDGLELLKEVRKKGKYVLITMPDYFIPGGAIMGNEAEIHKHIWKDNEFPDAPKIAHLGDQKVILYGK